jgi:endopeptidase La
MIEITVRDFMINLLQHEYNKFSRLIHDHSDHIERCHIDGIIQLAARNQHQKTLNDLIRNMNDIYNSKLIKLRGDDESKQIDNEEENLMLSKIQINKKTKNDPLDRNVCEILTNMKNKNFKLDNVTSLVNLWKNFNSKKYDELYINDFEIIRNKLLKISSEVGFYNIDDALILLVGADHDKFYDDNMKDFKNKFELYNRTFIPLNYAKKEKISTNNFIKASFINSEHEILIDNYCEVCIAHQFYDECYVFKGYFSYEPINAVVRTSQICRNFVYEKKKELQNTVAGIKYISEKFKNLYIKNLTLCEILSHDATSFSKQLDSDFEKYSTLSKMNFKNLMSEFTKDTQNNLKNMYTIIKLLLLGQDENVNIAGLLFGLTKDRKYNAEYVANIIFKNLNFNAQSKLRKSNNSLKQELDKLKAMSPDDIDLKKQVIAAKNMPQNIKKIALEKIEEMKSGSSEFYKQQTYVNILLNYPWSSDDDDVFNMTGKDLSKSREYLDKTKQILSEKVYGHEECKSVIVELIGKWLTNPKSIGKAIGLVGPPGVGKTLIAKGLGDALSIPFTQINLGGLEDGCVLSGHSYTYSAAQPGLIVRKMVDAGKSRCIMFFDELDKASNKHGVNEIFNVLIHATDTNTNANFNDKFFQEITFPLNKVLFVFSYNDEKLIDKILLDRMEKIEVKPYSIADKLVIAKDFLLKEVSEEVGFEFGSVVFTDNDLEYIAESFTFEAGVRELKRKIETIFLKLNLDRIYKKGLFEIKEHFSVASPIIITREIVDTYLKKPNLNIKKIHNAAEVGIINGLYATTHGVGGIIPILLYNIFIGSKSKFVIKITGQQGKVMKESVTFAFATAMNLIQDTHRKKFAKECPYGIHVHTPDGATPKDGPSAGGAFTTAFISRILGKKIRHDIAMTGEIELNGKITAIGGLQYKLTGAKKAGIKKVFVPQENKEDYDKIVEKDPKLLSDDFQVIIVDHISEILNHALLEDDDTPFDSSKYINHQYLAK